MDRKYIWFKWLAFLLKNNTECFTLFYLYETIYLRWLLWMCDFSPIVSQRMEYNWKILFGTRNLKVIHSKEFYYEETGDFSKYKVALWRWVFVIYLGIAEISKDPLFLSFLSQSMFITYRVLSSNLCSMNLCFLTSKYWYVQELVQKVKISFK